MPADPSKAPLHYYTTRHFGTSDESTAAPICAPSFRTPWSANYHNWLAKHGSRMTGNVDEVTCRKCLNALARATVEDLHGAGAASRASMGEHL